jgi:hypothetical protein
MSDTKFEVKLDACRPVSYYIRDRNKIFGKGLLTRPKMYLDTR